MQSKKDDEDEHTTASIKSSNTPSKTDINENGGDELVKSVEKPGPMSRMVKNLKSKGKGFSCTNSDTVIPDGKFIGKIILVQIKLK